MIQEFLTLSSGHQLYVPYLHTQEFTVVKILLKAIEIGLIVCWFVFRTCPPYCSAWCLVKVAEQSGGRMGIAICHWGTAAAGGWWGLVADYYED